MLYKQCYLNCKLDSPLIKKVYTWENLSSRRVEKMNEQPNSPPLLSKQIGNCFCFKI